MERTYSPFLSIHFMSETTTKRRVGAIFSSNKEKIEFLGYGTYEGEEVPPAQEDKSSFLHLLHLHNVKNPKISLDNGNVVWGCQCWWGDEDKVKQELEKSGKKVVEVSL